MTTWMTTFNTLRDAAVRRQETVQRVRKLQERRGGGTDDHAAFSTVLRIAAEDHRDAVRSLAQHGATAPIDDLKSLPHEARARLAGRLADAGAEAVEPAAIAAGLMLGASPYPLLTHSAVVARDDLLDLVLAGCAADGLNDEAKDQANARTWETVVLAYNGTGDDEARWIERLATVVLPRLARAGADLDRPLLGAMIRAARTTPSTREQRARVLSAALVNYRADVLRQTFGEAEQGKRTRRRL